ncbi:MAG TPA: hypothetical protein VHE79_00620 [Spirochaetia bacterium]
MLAPRGSSIARLALDSLRARGAGSHVRLSFGPPSALDDRHTLTLVGRGRVVMRHLDLNRQLARGEMRDVADTVLEEVRYAWLLLDEAPLPVFRIWRKSPRHLRGRAPR